MKQRKVERPKVKREWQMHAQMSRSVGLVQACHSNFTPFLPGPICEHISESPIWNPSSLKRLEKVLCRDVRGLFFFFLKKKPSAITVYTPLGSHPSRVFFFRLSSFAAIEQTPPQMTLLYTIHHSGFSLWIHFAPSWKFHIATNALLGWVSTIHKTCHQVVKYVLWDGNERCN